MENIIFMLKPIGITMGCFLICSCIVKPAKVSSYDAGCDMVTKKYELTLEQVKMFEDLNCENESCKVQFVTEVAGAIILTPVSAIVSSSIAVAGNTVYWLEKKGGCH